MITVRLPNRVLSTAVELFRLEAGAAEADAVQRAKQGDVEATAHAAGYGRRMREIAERLQLDLDRPPPSARLLSSRLAHAADLLADTLHHAAPPADAVKYDSLRFAVAGVLVELATAWEQALRLEAQGSAV